MQLLLELLPLGAFLATYLHYKDFYLATTVLMAGMVISLLILWARARRVPGMFAASTLLVLLAGTATLLLRNPKFIMWKPTVLLWLLALAFLGSAFIGKTPLAQRAMQPALGETQLPRSDWLRLNWAWVGYGLFTGAANILVAYNTTEAMWVKVKIPLLMGSMFLFMAGQIYWLYRTGRLKP